MQHKRVDVGSKLSDQKRHSLRRWATDEVHVAAEAIQLGDPERAPEPPCVLQGGFELRAPVQRVVALA